MGTIGDFVQGLKTKLLLAIFSKLPIVNYLDGHKRVLGDIISIFGVLIPVLQSKFPEVSLFGDLNSYYVLVAGFFTKYIGQLHADAKATVAK